VVARAAKLQELEMKPKKVPRAMLFGPDVPMVRCVRARVTSTWIRLLTKYPRAKAHSAIQKKPMLVSAASCHWEKN
jgi:hypothetical protein